MCEAISLTPQTPSHASRIPDSARPATAFLNRTNSVSAPVSTSCFSDMTPPLGPVSGDGPRRNALVEEQLTGALGQIVDIAAGREAQRRVHLDRDGIGLLRGGEHARARRYRLDGLEEFARDALAPEVLADYHERDEGALEPVGAVSEEADHLAAGLGDDEMVPLQVGLDERPDALLADHQGGQFGAGRRVGQAGQPDLDHHGNAASRRHALRYCRIRACLRPM